MESAERGSEKSPLFVGKLLMAGQLQDVTRLLDAASAGEEGAWGRLFSLLYDELRALAAELMRNERVGHTWQRTDLVHEAFVRLVGNKNVHWENRAHFFGAAGKAMRCLLVDHARRRNAAKRGGQDGRPVSLDEEHDLISKLVLPEEPSVDLEALDIALAKMEADERHRDKCKLTELHFFAGLTLEQTAHVLGKSLSTVKRDWTFAKAWLKRELSMPAGTPAPPAGTPAPQIPFGVSGEDRAEDGPARWGRPPH
jgi:RNA polymerase sigma factor (TIGR02999 family)